MCDSPANYKAQVARGYTPAQAATDLARLVENKLGYPEGHVDPVALRLFVRAYWTNISRLTHIIHAEEV